MPAGRPAELTIENETQFAPQVLHKLESAFLKGMNNREACFLANISEGLFYRVCKNSPELFDRFSMLQENVKVRAKEVVAEAIDKGDKMQANWYLERRAKDEFSPRQELTGANGTALISKEDAQTTVESLKNAAGLIASHETQSIADNGTNPPDSTQQVASDQNVV